MAAAVRGGHHTLNTPHEQLRCVRRPPLDQSLCFPVLVPLQMGREGRVSAAGVGWPTPRGLNEGIMRVGHPTAYLRIKAERTRPAIPSNGRVAVGGSGRQVACRRGRGWLRVAGSVEVRYCDGSVGSWRGSHEEEGLATGLHDPLTIFSRPLQRC